MLECQLSLSTQILIIINIPGHHCPDAILKISSQIIGYLMPLPLVLILTINNKYTIVSSLAFKYFNRVLKLATVIDEAKNIGGKP